jgi:hypothetical protein
MAPSSPPAGDGAPWLDNGAIGTPRQSKTGNDYDSRITVGIRSKRSGGRSDSHPRLLGQR